MAKHSLLCKRELQYFQWIKRRLIEFSIYAYSRHYVHEHEWWIRKCACRQLTTLRVKGISRGHSSSIIEFKVFSLRVNVLRAAVRFVFSMTVAGHRLVGIVPGPQFTDGQFCTFSVTSYDILCPADGRGQWEGCTLIYGNVSFQQVNCSHRNSKSLQKKWEKRELETMNMIITKSPKLSKSPNQCS